MVEGWKELKSPYSGVDMWIKRKQQLKGKNTINLGKSECIADCTAEEACAWFFEYCSNERKAFDREDGHHARLELGATKVNEKRFAALRR
jgi:hypothetical protein